MAEATEPLLEVRDLVTAFRTDEGVLRAVDGVSFSVPKGGTVGLVGESGCGKSVTSLSILRLLATPPASFERGEILFQGRDLLRLSEKEMCGVRGNRISMVFQEPMTSLNPVYTIGQQIAEAVRLHQKLDRKKAAEKAVEMLRLVGIPAPEERANAYPHQLSGGMRQRVMIAMALSCEPELLIADEPTTALDVTIQAQILDLLDGLRKRLGMSVLLITHDLGVVAEFAESVVVMYAGKVVERSPTVPLFRAPLHPYTKGLLESVPSFGDNSHKHRLPTIPGMVPDLAKLGPGCRFRERCTLAVARCSEVEPDLRDMGAGRSVACHIVEAT